MSRTVPFQKMHGAGNDFVMINGMDLNSEPLSQDQVAALCHRRTGIGADGLIIVGAAEKPDSAFRMIYFNADGGEAEMCGNGARCTVDYAHRAGLFTGTCLFDTFSGQLQGEFMAPGDVQVSLPAWKDLQLNSEMDGSPWPVQHICNTGVPHVVIPVDDVDDVDVVKWGAFFRYHNHFSPAGTNVNWVSPGPDGSSFLVRTYERGVEDETLACGTGASACAVVMCHLNTTSSPVSLRVRSGDLLTVSVDKQESALLLRGPAMTSFEGEVTIDD